VTNTNPSSAPRRSGATPYRGDPGSATAIPIAAARAARPARFTALPTLGTVAEAPAGSATGKRVSPSSNRTASRGTPSDWAAIWDITV
jgi:hypothetical protein